MKKFLVWLFCFGSVGLSCIICGVVALSRGLISESVLIKSVLVIAGIITFYRGLHSFHEGEGKIDDGGKNE